MGIRNMLDVAFVVIVLILGLIFYIKQNPTGAVTAILECIDTDVDSDGLQTKEYSNIFFSGVTKSGFEVLGDKCDGDILLETYCDTEGEIGIAEVECEFGCDRGKCLSPCEDADQKNYRVKGTTKGYILRDDDFLGAPPNYQRKEYTDYCYSPEDVYEYYCAGGKLRERIYPCNYFGEDSRCEDGMCVRP